MLNGQSSEWADVESGVPQGSVLGPILFILFINDIGDGLEGVLSIYADDTKHIYPVNSKHDASVLQSEIDLLDQWATTWDMKFNSTKCAMMHFGRNNQEHEYFLGNSTLNSTKAEKDVGVIVQENLKFDQHCKKVVNKCNQIIGQVWRSFENKEPGIMLDIYHTYILPHIDYGISVWYPHLQRDIDMLESIQRRFTKMITGMNGLTYEERLTVLELPTLEDRRLKLDLIQAYRIWKVIDKIDCQLFTTASSVNTKSTRGSTKLNFLAEKTSLSQRKHFFSNRVVNSWNSLPKHVQTAKNLSSFKSLLRTILF